MGNLQYLTSVKKEFEYYKLLGEKTFSQLNDENLFSKVNNESNSISSIVKHLSGNMVSRWTDFLTTDGEKEWRKREEEFDNDIKTREELLEIWEKGWSCLFNSLNSITDDELSKVIYIRNQGHTILEGINRQLSHYPYHIGQIVYIGKMLCDNSWVSLSIPKGSSNEYNQEKFSKPKSNQHFTDEIIGRDLENI